MEIPLKKIAEVAAGEIIGDGSIIITGVNSLDAARQGEISFFVDKRYEGYLNNTGASAVVVSEKTDFYKGAQVVVANPGLAFARVTELFAPSIARYPGISEQAFVHKDSLVGHNVSIYPMAYVGKDAVIGDGTVLFPGAFVGDRARVGKGAVIHANVSILHDCRIGDNVIIHAGTVIGSDGFGYVKEGTKSVKRPQIGIVQIDDDAEIGANNCIDRAALGRTWIQRGVKTDNLVQIAHNVVIGEDSLVLAQVGISGSVTIGREVILAGQVGIADHKDIGDRAVIGPQSGIAKNVMPGEVLSGSPAIPHRLWLKTSGIVRRLPEFSDRLRIIEKKMEELEKKL